MAVYTLNEMTDSLKTGLWQGGEVDKIGYVGRAVLCADTGCERGLRGIYVSYDTMLESCEPSGQGGGCELVVSQYQPYTGTYAVYRLESYLSDRESLVSRLMDIVAGKRDAYIWSHNLTRRNTFAIERHYTADYSGRGGKIGTPRQSGMFGR